MLQSPKQTKQERMKQLLLMKEAKEIGTFSESRLNRWQQEKLMQTTVTKDMFQQMPNEKYFNVSSKHY